MPHTVEKNFIRFFPDEVKALLTKSQCTLLRIRAGIFLKPDCLSTLTSFLYNYNNVKLVIYAHSHDSMPIKDLVTSLNVVGQNNVLLDLPDVIGAKIQTLSGSGAVEDFSSPDLLPELSSAPSFQFPRILALIVILSFFLV